MMRGWWRTEETGVDEFYVSKLGQIEKVLPLSNRRSVAVAGIWQTMDQLLSFLEIMNDLSGR